MNLAEKLVEERICRAVSDLTKIRYLKTLDPADTLESHVSTDWLVPRPSVSKAEKKTLLKRPMSMSPQPSNATAAGAARMAKHSWPP